MCSSGAGIGRVAAWNRAARSRLLIEQPGPWGRDALHESGMNAAVAAEIEHRAGDAGVRVMLIRRSVRTYEPGQRAAFLVYPGRDKPWMEEIGFKDPAELLPLDLSAAHCSEPPGIGRAVSSPRYLICTTGRKDPCCAEFGRPVARALRHHGDRVWESSHVGGDRFAANMVCLPHGVFYGQVEAHEADALIDQFDSGKLSIPHFRGRCCDHPLEQVADHAVRAALGITEIDGLTPLSRSTTTSGEHHVTVNCDDGDIRVRLRSTPGAERVTSCSGPHHGHPDHHHVIDISPEVR